MLLEVQDFDLNRAPLKKLVVCSTQRCGSTMLAKDMFSSGVMGKPKEWFLRWHPDKTETDWSAALEQLIDRSRSPNGVMSVKVMANQLSNTDRCLSSFIATEETGPFPYFAKLFEDAVWIKISRCNVVLQAISRIMAQQTGIYHVTGDADEKFLGKQHLNAVDENYNAEVVYRYPRVLRVATAITRENLAWEQFFEAHGIVPYRLYYEDIAADPDMAHLDEIARLAGLQDVPNKRARDMVKLANRHNLEWEERFFRDMFEKRISSK